MCFKKIALSLFIFIICISNTYAFRYTNEVIGAEEKATELQKKIKDFNPKQKHFILTFYNKQKADKKKLTHKDLEQYFSEIDSWEIKICEDSLEANLNDNWKACVINCAINVALLWDTCKTYDWEEKEIFVKIKVPHEESSNNHSHSHTSWSIWSFIPQGQIVQTQNTPNTQVETIPPVYPTPIVKFTPRVVETVQAEIESLKVATVKIKTIAEEKTTPENVTLQVKAVEKIVDTLDEYVQASWELFRIAEISKTPLDIKEYNKSWTKYKAAAISANNAVKELAIVWKWTPMEDHTASLKEKPLSIDLTKSSKTLEQLTQDAYDKHLDEVRKQNSEKQAESESGSITDDPDNQGSIEEDFEEEHFDWDTWYSSDLDNKNEDLTKEGYYKYLEKMDEENSKIQSKLEGASFPKELENQAKVVEKNIQEFSEYIKASWEYFRLKKDPKTLDDSQIISVWSKEILEKHNELYGSITKLEALGAWTVIEKYSQNISYASASIAKDTKTTLQNAQALKYTSWTDTQASTATAEKKSKIPTIKCGWLPGCNSAGTPVKVEWIFSTIIAETIKYVAVCAVIALMISGIMYMLSGWEEEKTSKAKKWILYSMVAVVISMLSWFIITTLNTLTL